MGCRRQSHLVELAYKVHKCDRETCVAAAAATFDFDWEDRRVRLGLVVAVWIGVVAEGAGDEGTHAGFVFCDDEEQLQRNRLYNDASSMVFVGNMMGPSHVPVDRP